LVEYGAFPAHLNPGPQIGIGVAHRWRKEIADYLGGRDRFIQCARFHDPAELIVAVPDRGIQGKATLPGIHVLPQDHQKIEILEHAVYVHQERDLLVDCIVVDGLRDDFGPLAGLRGQVTIGRPFLWAGCWIGGMLGSQEAL